MIDIEPDGLKFVSVCQMWPQRVINSSVEGSSEFPLMCRGLYKVAVKDACMENMKKKHGNVLMCSAISMEFRQDPRIQFKIILKCDTKVFPCSPLLNCSALKTNMEPQQDRLGNSLSHSNSSKH